MWAQSRLDNCLDHFMANPKATAATKGYRQTVKSKDASGNIITTTNYTTNTERVGSVQPPRSGGGSSSGGGSVELFIVGTLFIWAVVSGKLEAIITVIRS